MNWSHVQVGDAVKIFMGAGWTKGTLVRKLEKHVVVQIKDRLVCCYDDRNIKR